ncbi:SET domain-containing protein [Schizopora paradoxa]|uniref:SET domain-containing protein n=1 Tax=Schizopora paradoxa TaxID=27342 RepID=A0A0H2S5V5_9AGAM|nr:SET domain-containing protein [Schizopora paradoxa]
MPAQNEDVPMSPLCDSDVEIYSASASEPEEYSDNGNGEWEVEKIHGVEIDHKGKRRYEVQWKDWQRSDGSSTTWEELDGEDVKEVFEHKLEKRNRELAKAGGSIEIKNIASCLPHNIHTAEVYEAYEMKLRRWRGSQSQAGQDWDAEIENVRKRHIRNDDLKAESPAESSASGSSSLSKKRKRKVSISTVSSDSSHASKSTVAGPSARRFKREASALSNVRPHAILFNADNLSVKQQGNITTNPVSAKAKLRSKHSSQCPAISLPQSQEICALARSWTEAACAAGAARIEIVNDLGTGEIPRLSQDFRYLEKECRFGKGVKHPSEFENFMMGCSCGDDCGGPLSCDCQNTIEFHNELGELVRAYDNKGIFLFNNYGAEVIECNDKCSCTEQCTNRVAQKPRDVVLQIFKTARNGWGVRCGQAIPRGKVLGIYTGEIITREAADRISVNEHTYLFNLDTRDGADDSLNYYTVDATHCGNWTRFINHSCKPNASVYSVVYDNILENNMPYLAVVANQDIPPYVELTFDYNPGASAANASQAPNSVTCKCGSDNCRGWLF